MTETVRGELVWQKTKKGRGRRVIFPTRKGSSLPRPFVDTELAPELAALDDDKIEVEFELEGGQPRRIRPVGASWTQPGPPRPTPRPGGDRRRDGRRPPPDRRRPGEFHNPYNFVPALPRGDLSTDLADRAPTDDGHHHFAGAHFSGRITVRATLKTPLLLPDAATAVERDGHSTFEVRLDAEGRPLIAPSSIRGALRTAYEAVTNSRLGVLDRHADRLAYRMPAGDGLGLVPARVTGDDLELCLGTTNKLPGHSNGRWQIPGGMMYAAWLPRYDAQRGGLAGQAIRYTDRSMPEHEDAVVCWLERFQHHRWNRNANRHVSDFEYWRVRAIARADDPSALGTAPSPSRDAILRPGRSAHQPIRDSMLRVSGWVCVTNQNINRKHDERVFFHAPDTAPIRRPLSEDDRRAWRELIANYQATHTKELELRERDKIRPYDYRGREPGRTAWSRHIYTERDRELHEGTLCHAAIEPGTTRVLALYPVMISRKLHRCAPIRLIDESLRPPTRLEQLSPADRVFGWASQDGHGAFKGKLRCGPMRGLTAGDVEHFESPGLPLAILGQPKPQQTRFYVAADKLGTPLANGIEKDAAGYDESKGIRGRKIYPHHRNLSAGDFSGDVTADHGREYRRRTWIDGRRDRSRDDQNRSLLGWIKAGTTFDFDLYVTNLSRVEAGALLWLLSLGENAYHRLGGGKPLGFGSARLEIDGLELHDGAALRDWYTVLDDVPPPGQVDAARLISAFEQAAMADFGRQSGVGFDQLPFIAAFRRATEGFDDGLPVHYPRSTRHASPEGCNYEWFVANDRTGYDAGPGEALRSLASDDGLPILSSPQQR